MSDADLPILPRLPRLPLRTFDDLLLCADELHSDRCMWMGGTSRPCTCGAGRVVRMLAALYGDLLRSELPGGDGGHGEAPAGTGA